MTMLPHYPIEEITMNRRSFALSAVSLALLPTAAAAQSVTGRYVAQKKEAKLAFASAFAGDGAAGKETVIIVASEKDHSASKAPAKDAEFGKFGSAVIITLGKPDGVVSEVLLAHADFPQSPVQVSGTIKGVDVKFADDGVTGRFTSNGPKTMFEGRPYETMFDVDLQISAKIKPKAG
jgi:hypothetical protein